MPSCQPPLHTAWITHYVEHCLRPKLPQEITDNRNLARSFLRLLVRLDHSSKIRRSWSFSFLTRRESVSVNASLLCHLPFALLTFVPLLIFVSLLLHWNPSGYPIGPSSSMIRHLPATMFLFWLLRKSVNTSRNLFWQWGIPHSPPPFFSVDPL
ncbi:hypothetical protein V8B55DRAFT_1052872 [Mucor lusitanicus]